mgnify:FL=1
MNEIEFQKEKIKLDRTLEIIREILIDEKEDLKKLSDNFIGSRDELWKIADRKKLHISNLEVSENKPYFARIDFTSDDDGKMSTVYIGKNGVSKSSDIIVTDWRAPISSLYYDAEIGKCSFKAPSGEIKGNMSLKRQYEIDNGKLQEYFDVDLVSQDSLLQKYLNGNNDARLKSIVSTIQKEQNDVIREELYDNIIVQGVAGSGKTTVALHRIAYLVYNYIKKIKQNQYLVIGPNPVFLKYIKSVLPELDVDGVAQCTYEGFVKNYIGEDIKINLSDKKVVESILGFKNSDVDKFKCSMKYQKMLEQFMQLYIYSITSKPLMLGNFEVLSRKTITQIFQSTENDFSNSLNNRIENTIDKLYRYIGNEQDKILLRYSDYSYELFKTATTETEKNEMRKMFAKDRAEISKKCKSAIRKYFNKSKISTTKVYKLFINSIFDYDIYHYDKLNELKKETMKNIKNSVYDFEDLAALLYIKFLTSPNREYDRIKHVVIDEAQDLGEFNFFTLKKTLPSATFSVFGDLAQSIYDYRGIDSWEEVNDIMFNKSGKIINFNKSYRTTAEIMNVADDVAESIGLGRSDLVIRHGDEVNLTELVQNKDVPMYIIQKICEYKEKGYKTIAIISKTDVLSEQINSELTKLGVNIPNVTVNDDLSDEKFRICTISNQLAKGLEFDAVIINDASEKVYSSENNLDMKLLYVAITRALHELDIVYSGTLTKPLEKHLKKKGKQRSLTKS